MIQRALILTFGVAALAFALAANRDPERLPRSFGPVAQASPGPGGLPSPIGMPSPIGAPSPAASPTP